MLEKARKGIFPLAAMRDYTIAYQNAGGRQDFSSYYMADQKNAILQQSLRRNVIFAQHNLASDGVFNEFHLVLCRNVGIYFDEPLRLRMHELIYDSLVPLGRAGPRQEGVAALHQLRRALPRAAQRGAALPEAAVTRPGQNWWWWAPRWAGCTPCARWWRVCPPISRCRWCWPSTAAPTPTAACRTCWPTAARSR